MASTEEWFEKLWREGRWEELLNQAHVDYSAARVAQDPAKQSKAENLRALVYGAMGNWNDALKAARAALRNRHQIGDLLGTARALAGLSLAYAANRGALEALKLFQMSNNAFHAVGEPEERCLAAATLGQVLISLKRTGEARAVLDEAIGLCKDDALAWCRWMLLELKSRAYRAEHDLEAAIKCMEEVFLLHQREGAVSAACLRTIADLYLDAGRGWEATEMYRMAITHARELGADAEVQRTEARIREATHQSDIKQGRLTIRGLKVPTLERSH